MTKKICILTTGGTIGMITRDHISSQPPQPLDYAKLFPSLSELADIDYHPLFYVDSSAIGISQWMEIIDAVAARLNDYDGFIITHGTDTMPFSAAALAYAYSDGLNHPIVLTGSQRTPDMPNSDAESNLRAAILLATSPLAEVAIAFNQNAWRGCRTIKISNQDDNAFKSLWTPDLAELNTTCKLNYSIAKVKQPDGETISPVNNFSDQLCLFYATPSANSAHLMEQAVSPHWQIGLVVGMGNGNLPPGFISFIMAAKKQHKEIIITSSNADSSQVSYPPLRECLDAGAIYASGYTLPSLWVKLCWLAAQTGQLSLQQRYDFLKQALEKSYVGEKFSLD